MPFIRSLASKRRAYIVVVILLLSKTILTCSRCVLKGLVCITVITLLSRQFSFYTKCTKLNIRLFCNIRLVFNTKCMFFAYRFNL